MLKNSIRQMLRTPVKTFLFFILLAAGSLLLVLGVNLFYISGRIQDEAEGAFTTIGTVRQKSSSLTREKSWNPFTQCYDYGDRAVYDEYRHDTDLDVEGIPYIHKPKQYPYYIAYKDGYKVVDMRGSEVDEGWYTLEGSQAIAEVTPYEDCVPDHPVKLHYNKVIYGKIDERMLEFIWFWDIYNPEPEPLYAGKTYLMTLDFNTTHWMDYKGLLDREKYPEVTTVWIPAMDNQGFRALKDGTKLEDKEHEGRYYDEITEGFYESAEGRRWLNLIEGYRMAAYSFPVVPTDATKLLLYFYNGDAGIWKGRDISEEEYETGKKVCLVQEEFAKINGFQVGDSIQLPLYAANYRFAAGQGYPLWASINIGETMIDTEGELYRPFEESSYEIVGIYQVTGGWQDTSGRNAPKNGVIIPMKSVQNSDENNILYHGPMREFTTVFQLENGKVDTFWDIWNRQGIDNLEITFYDSGYGALEQSFRNTRKMAVILLAAGCGTVVLILLFFCQMFVSRQKLRIAVERTLGASKGQCRRSVLGGILLLAVLGSMAGSLAGAAFTGKIAGRLEKRTAYSAEYSASKVMEEEHRSPAELLREGHMDVVLPAGAGVAVAALAVVVSGLMAGKNLREEPLALLAKMKREL